MIQFFSIEDIDELVLKAHSYISRIGIKIIDDKTCEGSSILEGHFYRFINLLDVIESRKNFDTTEDKFQRLVYKLYGYVNNECIYYNSLYLELGNSSGYLPITINTTFLQLLDTPDSYLGQATKLVSVNNSETGLEFVNISDLFQEVGNGLIVDSDTGKIYLGGSLVTPTIINTHGTQFFAVGNASAGEGGSIQILPNGSALAVKAVSGALNKLVFNGTIGDATDNTIVFTDDIASKGVVYAHDYSTLGKLDNRWIPDWGTISSSFAIDTNVVHLTGFSNQLINNGIQLHNTTDDYTLAVQGKGISNSDYQITTNGSNAFFNIFIRNGLGIVGKTGNSIASFNDQNVGADNANIIFYFPASGPKFDTNETSFGSGDSISIFTNNIVRAHTSQGFTFADVNNINYKSTQHTFKDLSGNSYLTLGNGSDGPLSEATHLRVTNTPSSNLDVVRLGDLSSYVLGKESTYTTTRAVYNKSYWSDISDFTATGFTPTISTVNGLVFTGGAGNLTQYISVNGTETHDDICDFEVIYNATSISGYGIKIGRISINPGDPYSVMGGYDLLNNLIEISHTVGTSNVVSQSSSLSISIGDTCKLKLTQRKREFSITFTNITKSDAVSHIDSYVTAGVTAPSVNAGRFVIYNISGSTNISSIRMTTSNIYKPDIAFLGDSKTYFSDSVSIAALSRRLGQTITYAGGSDSTRELVQTVDYLINYIKPKAVVLDAIARNDLSLGLTWQPNYLTIVSKLNAAGIKIVHMLPIPETAISDQSSIYNFITSSFTAPFIDPSVGWDNSLYLNADGIHPNNEGKRFIANLVITSGLFPLANNSYNDMLLESTVPGVALTHMKNVFTNTQLIYQPTFRVKIGTPTRGVTLSLLIDDGTELNATLKANTSTGFMGGIGNTIASNNFATNNYYTASATTTSSSIINFMKSAGTTASLTTVANATTIGQIFGSAYDGASFLATAAIRMITDGTVSTNVAPQKISFYTALTNSLLERVTIGSNGTLKTLNNIVAASAAARSIHVNNTLTPIANADNLIGLDFVNTYAVGTGALTATITTNTTSLADGTYDNLASTATSGVGIGQTWKLTVLGGVVTVIVPAGSANGGSGYAVGNTFTVATSTGSVFTVASLGYTGIVKFDIRSTGGIQTNVLQLPNSISTALTTTVNSAIYGSSSSGGVAYPFLGNGNLILQSRSSAAQDIVFITGTTPTPKISIYGGSGNIQIGGTLGTDAGFKADIQGTLRVSGHTTIEGIVSTGATGTGNFVYSISPTLTGVPLSTTAALGTNTTQIATTAFVKSNSVQKLKTFFTDVLATTSAADAYVYTIPANTLVADGQVIYAEYIASENGLTGTETILFYFAGIQILNTGAIVPINGEDKIRVTIIRDSPTSFKSDVFVQRDANPPVYQPSQHNSGTFNPAVTNDMKFNIVSSISSVFTLNSGIITYMP